LHPFDCGLERIVRGCTLCSGDLHLQVRSPREKHHDRFFIIYAAGVFMNVQFRNHEYMQRWKMKIAARNS